MTRTPDLAPAAAEAMLFERALFVAPADDVATFSLWVGRGTLASMLEHMLAGHALSIATPGLARLFRSLMAIDDVESAAAQFAPRIARDPAEAGAAAVARYKRGLAEQLAAVDGHELQRAAKAYLAGLAAGERAEAERAAALEAARVQCEHAEAERLAAETEAAALRAAEAEIAARRRTLQQRLAARLEAARHAPTLGRRCLLSYVGAEQHRVDEILAAVPGMTLEQLAAHEASLDGEVA